MHVAHLMDVALVARRRRERRHRNFGRRRRVPIHGNRGNEAQVRIACFGMGFGLKV